MEKTLYVSDLDGTLLTSRQTLSDYTAETINRLAQSGMIFSYATARSFTTASAVTEKLAVPLPVIVYNGAFMMNQQTGAYLHASYFQPDDARRILRLLLKHSISCIAYTVYSGRETFRYVPALLNAKTAAFVADRKDDPRNTEVLHADDLLQGQAFYFTCIDEPEKLQPVYRQLAHSYYCVYANDIYSGDSWLEIMPQGVSKAAAALKLKALLHCDRMIAFGDGANDLPLFQASDACYAMENADDALMAIATGVIGGNDADGVARWLGENVRLP